VRLRSAALISAGTIAGLLLIGIGLVSIVAALTSIPRNLGVHTTAADCMPSDFPRYAAAQRAFGFMVGPICSEEFTTSDSVDQVTSFFQEQLQAWPWRVTRFTSTPPATIYFGRQDSTQAAGEIQEFATRTGSRFTITYSP
jgi:hypothetical protein